MGGNGPKDGTGNHQGGQGAGKGMKQGN
jgi:hypothetical protein